MAQSGGVGVGPPWVGRATQPALSQRILPRPPPPPRPKMNGGGPEAVGSGNAVAYRVVDGSEVTSAKGIQSECPSYSSASSFNYGNKLNMSPWESPSSTTSSAYFSYPSTCSTSPPPSASSPLTPFTPANFSGNEDRVDRQPKPKSSQKDSSSKNSENVKDLPYDRLPLPSPPPSPPYHTEGGCPEDEGSPLFRRPSEGSGTSVIRRRATVEVRSVAVQTPSALMSAFDSRATYPRAKGHCKNARPEAGKRSSCDEDDREQVFQLPPKKMSHSATACEWHSSFVGGDVSRDVGRKKEAGDESLKGVDRVETTVCGKEEDVAPVSSSAGEEGREGKEEKDVEDQSIVGREEGGSAEAVAKVSVGPRRVISRAELCPAPQIAYTSIAQNGDQASSATSSERSATSPSVFEQSTATMPSTPQGQQVTPPIPAPRQLTATPSPTTVQQTNPIPPVLQSKPSIPARQLPPSPLSVPIRQHSSPSIPASQQTIPSISARQQSSPSFTSSPKPAPFSRSVQQSTASTPPNQQSTPSSPSTLRSTPTSQKSTPRPSVDPRHRSPLAHWLTELRSSSDAIEDEEEVTMEEKGEDVEDPEGTSFASVQDDIVLRSGGGLCLSNRRRRGSGGEISIYEDACSCCNGEECCGLSGGPEASSTGQVDCGGVGVISGDRITTQGGGKEVKAWESDVGQKGTEAGKRGQKEEDCSPGGGGGGVGGGDSSRGGGYKGIWGIDGSSAEGEGVVIRTGRTRGEGIESRLSALGLVPKDRDKEDGKVDVRRLGEGLLNRGAWNCRRTYTEGMCDIGKGKGSTPKAKETDMPVGRGEAKRDTNNTKGGGEKELNIREASSRRKSMGFLNEGQRIEKCEDSENKRSIPSARKEEEGGRVGGSSPLATDVKKFGSFSKGRGYVGSLDRVDCKKGDDSVTPSGGQKVSQVMKGKVASLEEVSGGGDLQGRVRSKWDEEDEEWPRKSKFTEEEMLIRDMNDSHGDGLFQRDGKHIPDNNSNISYSDSFKSTSSESKLSSSSSQEIPTTGYNSNNTKSSSCDNVSSSGGESKPSAPPRKKPPRKHIKAKDQQRDTPVESVLPKKVGKSESENSLTGERKTERLIAVAPPRAPALTAPREESARLKDTPTCENVIPAQTSDSQKSQTKEERSPSDSKKTPPEEKKKNVVTLDAAMSAASKQATSEDKGSSKENTKSDKRIAPVKSSEGANVTPSVDERKSSSDGKSSGSVAAGGGKKWTYPFESKAAELTGKSAKDKKTVGEGPRLSSKSEPSDLEGCGSERSAESVVCDEEEECDEDCGEEEEEEGEVRDDWKGVYVRGRRKGSYSSDIEAWKRGLSGWCSVEDEDEFLESTMFDQDESSMSVGCGSPVVDAERSAEEWYSSNDMDGRIYYFEENSNESSWTLPEVSVVSPPQTPPPTGISASPVGSDSFISGKSSGGEEGGNCSKEGVEHENGGLILRRDELPMQSVKSIQSQWEKGGRVIQPMDSTMEKDGRGSRNSRAIKTRSMVIGDPAINEIKIPIPGKISSVKDWPQLWDGNMCVLREGTLNRTKITENGKRVRKNWAPSHVVLTELFLLFFKDAKTFAAMRAGSLGGLSAAESGAIPELCVDLNGALVERGDRLSSRKNVFLVSTVLGLQVLCQDDNAQNSEAWYQDVSKAVHFLPSGFDGSPRQNTMEMRNYPETHSPDEHKKFPRIGRSKSVKIKKDASMEDLSAASVTERQVKIRARLKKFFHRRPTMESLVKKGIWKDEPAFGCFLEQVSGEGIPRIPLFVQRCIAAIESKPENMKADGLYRASGNLSQVQKIRLQVDQNNLSILDIEEDVHVLTGALKLFFRELKEPLIPYSLFNRALSASTNSNRKEQLHEFREIAKILPVANYDTLKFLLQHLLRVTKFQESNRMHIANLAIVFGPTLMWPKQESQNMALDLMQQNLVIEWLLQEFDTIFSSAR